VNKPKFREPALFSSAGNYILMTRTYIVFQMLVYSPLNHGTRMEGNEGYMGFIQCVLTIRTQ